MNFPDLQHLRQLQTDLWQWPGSRAAVMVGAGLSLHSEPLPGVTTRFPTWRQLARAMFDELYALSPEDTSELQAIREEQFKGTNALRLASEYEAAFGLSRLERLIRKHIPDSGHEPGELHRLLLRLPWKDVFTTNYDTLLERTEVSGRAYQLVTTMSDLTTAFSPRIIKLHGSFPSHTPFIITEEDYRTYPRKFAPFVNSVQQSLIENSFVLVGFSGDDPNFLQWIGWIRDELGNRHAPIYLVGLLFLNTAQRSLLTQRGVTPIDLTPVFSNLNPANRIHSDALEWFFLCLLAAKPQRPENWPWSEDTTPPIPVSPSGLPIIGRSSDTPPAVKAMPPEQTPLDSKTVAQVMARWKFERNRFPGWLVAPHTMRSALWRNTDPWIVPLTKSCNDWPAVDRVLVFRELNWRFESALIPLFPESIAPFETAVDDLFDSMKNSVALQASIEELQGTSHADIAKAWLEIAFGLLREARETYNASRWRSLKDKIDQVVKMYSLEVDRSQYEEALWRMWNIERNEAKSRMTKWQPSSGSPLALMWKAGLLAELDELGEARSLLQTALGTIRTTLRKQGQNIELLSLEGWCTYLLHFVELSLTFPSLDSNRQEFSERWQELKAWDCDPRTTLSYFHESLSQTPPSPRSGRHTTRTFDPGERTITYHFTDNENLGIPAFAYIRFYEQVGMPMRLPWINLFGRSLLTACEQIAPLIGYWSPAIFVRAGRVEELMKYELMSRVQVAGMQSDIAKRLYAWGIEAIKRELESFSGRVEMHPAQKALLKVLPELLSRLAFKVGSAELEKTFPIALQFHQAQGIRSHRELHNTLELWFKRMFHAANEKQLGEWLSDLIRTPLVDEERLVHEPAWPDSMRHFPYHRVRKVEETQPELLPKIQVAIDWLLRRAQGASGEEKQRALARLTGMYRGKLMTTEQGSALGTLLWDQIPDDDVTDSQFFFNYLHLPAPANINVPARIKEKILNFTPVKSDLPSTNDQGERMILEVAWATKPVIQLTDELVGVIEWSSSESRTLWEKAFDWWEHIKDFLTSDFKRDTMANTAAYTLKHFDIFLARAVLPYMAKAKDKEWRKIFRLLSEAKGSGVYLSVCLPYVLLHRPSQNTEVTQAILDGFGSNTEAAVQASATAVRHWIHLADADKVNKPDPHVLDSLINRVIFRMDSGILSCIGQLSRLLIEKPDYFSSEQIQLILASLVPWDNVTRVPVLGESGGDFAEEDRPDLRASLGSLAGALSRWLKRNSPGEGEPEEIKRWRDSCQQDPLPEVRRSFDVWENVIAESSGYASAG